MGSSLSGLHKEWQEETILIHLLSKVCSYLCKQVQAPAQTLEPSCSGLNPMGLDQVTKPVPASVSSFVKWANNGTPQGIKSVLWDGIYWSLLCTGIYLHPFT